MLRSHVTKYISVHKITFFLMNVGKTTAIKTKKDHDHGITVALGAYIWNSCSRKEENDITKIVETHVLEGQKAR